MSFASVESLTLRHIGRRAPALRGLDLEWHQGERLLLLGPSGSGKSTLALCLDGVIPHSLDAHWEAGRVVVNGRDTREARISDLVRDVGILFQDPEAQLVMLEVDDEIAFGLENLGVPRDRMRERIAAARAATALDSSTPRLLADLSGGTKQRVTLASLLAMRPRGLVLDEPTATLDPAGAREVLAAFASLAADRERSLLIVEHRVDEVLRHVDRVAVLDGEGHLAMEGDPDRVFLGEAQRLRSLGVWEPDLAALARATGAQRVPRTADEAAALVTSRDWPVVDEPVASARGRPLIAARAVRYRYERASRDAVAGVDIILAEGECVAIVGPNGAGKSTLGLLLAGVLRPSAGEVTLAARSRVAYVFQYPEHQFVASTVRADLRFGLSACGVAPAEADRRATATLEQFGLARLAEANPYSLSHGEKRRLSVASALVTDPQVLLLDEPTFGQDRRNVDELGALVDERVRAGGTVVVITHDLPFVAAHATRVIALADGRVVFEGAPQELFARADVLTRCRLVLPPLAEAFRRARAQRPGLPLISSRAELDRALRRSAVPA